MPEPRIESLLSARLFLAPQLWDDRIYFISNLSGHFSLYRMNYGGSVPEPLLPPHIALQNPELIEAYSFYVFPKLGKILVAIDRDGDEKYQPMFIPLEGGFPESPYPDFAGEQVFIYPCDASANMAYLLAASQTESLFRAYQADLEKCTLLKIGESPYGGFVDTANDSHTQAVMIDDYSPGDRVVYLWKEGQEGRKLLYGVPIEERAEGQKVPVNAITSSRFTPSDKGLVFLTALFEDTYGVGYLDLADPAEVKPVSLTGTVHSGTGEMTGLRHVRDERYLVEYNIDGVSWAYEGTFDEDTLTLDLDKVICGQGELSGGVMKSINYNSASDRYVLAFSTASSPTQLYTVEGKERDKVVRHTCERILGTPESHMSKGEDVSFTSFDGLRVSARLYMPSEELGFGGPRPLVYYIHGGPQGQERPNFAWFSMPLIQFLTLNGFAVFVPNVRGSTGYGLSYMKHVDHDWGGQDRLDHVHAMKLLADEPRVDVKRAGVIGRSYGGYMTLTLATRHPELWSAAVDMFGIYNLITSIERFPVTWKPFAYQTIGHPEKERDFLLERSPSTYIDNISCPLLVMQGANDPRVVERESRDVVEQLRERGKEVDYVVFENEGHDVIKYENKVRCYNTITEFFKKHLRPDATNS
ncbi:MAG TPA: prolyl oligopeptidase family serine peptidase [Chloroflexia bacterium]|nr:prolyl oligopeptidase family serine peptidase [Chloroflexia bacterium]